MVQKVITSGNSEINKNMCGGVPGGSMTLVGGESGPGKPFLTQQLVGGSLHYGFPVIFLTTEDT